MIVESGNPFLDLWYEELFDPKLPFEAKEEMLAGIFRFLGLDPALPAHQRERVGLPFEPREGPLNSNETYLRVPGIADVETRFGSDATGYLFR